MPIPVAPGRKFNLDALDNLEPESGKPDHLSRVVGKKPQFPKSKVGQDLGTGSVIPQIRREPEAGVRIDRVQAAILQGVDNIYEIDTTRHILDRATELSGSRYGADHTDDVRLRANDARGNVAGSCQDETTGDGTLGTDNTWIDNLGELDSSSPAGICGGATPP